MQRSMHNRLSRLEDAARLDVTCYTCGAPATLNPAVVVTRNLDPLPQCSGCGRALNDDGRPLPRIFKRIVLPEGDPFKDAVAPD